MKVTKPAKQQNRAFTLIEMIGVLAVIAILAALLIPKVFQAITEARINTVPVGAATCKTATVDHYAKYSGLNILFGTNAMTTYPITNYDERILMAEQLLDKPFAPRVGANADIVLASISTQANGDQVTTSEGLTYCLTGGTNPGTNDVTGAHVVFATIEQVPVADAQAISMRIDGLAMSEPEGSKTEDTRGRVKYNGTTDPTTIYIYLTHR